MTLEASFRSLHDQSAQIGDTRWDLAAPRRGWIRRLAPSDWRRDAAPSSHAGVVRASWAALLVGTIELSSVEWLTPLMSMWRAENKLVQLAAAARLGIDTPRTCIVSSTHSLPEWAGSEIVVKPLGPATYAADHGQARVVHAELLPRDADELNLLGAAPFLVQEPIDAHVHLRVVTLNDKTWICGIGAPPEFDWRRNAAAHKAFRKVEGFERVGEAAKSLAQMLVVGYSSQDWVVTPEGACYFLDLNPGGQWLFLPDEISAEVSAAIANWLVSDG